MHFGGKLVFTAYLSSLEKKKNYGKLVLTPLFGAVCLASIYPLFEAVLRSKQREFQSKGWTLVVGCSYSDYCGGGQLSHEGETVSVGEGGGLGAGKCQV